jgi:hypothetical protein
MTHDVEETSAEVPAAEAIENLVSHVTNLLIDKGHPNPEAWKQYLQPGVETLPDPDYQQFAINRAWRVIFGKLKEANGDVDTMDVRYCLIDQKGSVENWKRLFEMGVLPCIIEHSLPLSE